MARFYAGNKLASFYRTNTAIVEGTTAGHFDNTCVANSIDLLAGSAEYIQTLPFIDAASTTTLWHKGHFWNPGLGVSVPLIQFLNAGGTVIARLQTNGSGVPQFQYWNGSAYVDLGATLPLTNFTLSQIDIKLTCGAGGTIDIFKAGTNIVSASGMNAAVDSITAVRLFSASGLGSQGSWSHIIGQDADTRNFKMLQAAINGNGADTAGTGAYTDVNETPLNEGTAIVLPAVGNAKSFTKAALTVPNGFSIDSAWCNGRARVSGGVVTDGKLGFRSSGADYVSAGKVFSGAYEPRGHYTTTDPATSAAWTETSYNAAEVLAKAA